MLEKRLREEFSFEVRIATSKAEALTIAESEGENIFISLMNLTLPDAPDGEAVDAIIELGIPTIVFSGRFESQIRTRMLQKRVVDYIPKVGRRSLDYLMQLLHRLLANTQIEALIVDDSATSRTHFSNLLSQMLIPNVCVNDAKEAIATISKDPYRYSLLLIDFHMQDTTGLELVHELQNITDTDRMAIIGISGVNDHFLTAQFLKAGSTDFLYKSSSYEEFLCRISQALKNLDHVKALEEAASTDYLTKLKNRRSLFDIGNMLWKQSNRELQPKLHVAMIDMDHFKNINDQHGHEFGDLTLVRMANLLKESFRTSDLIVRYGGEEFCVLLCQSTPEQTQLLMENFRAKVAAQTFQIMNVQIPVTISIGICTEQQSALEDMINLADQRLYAAKAKGRNCVVFD